MSVKLGSFIYDRKIGSYSDTLDKNDEYYPQRLELVLNEAVAGFENTYVKVLECENAITVEVTIEGERRTEVLLNGNI
jgi:hypothetical protein